MHKSKSTDCPELSKALPANLQAVQSCQKPFQQIYRLSRAVNRSSSKSTDGAGLSNCHSTSYEVVYNELTFQVELMDCPELSNGLCPKSWQLLSKRWQLLSKRWSWQLLSKGDSCCSNLTDVVQMLTDVVQMLTDVVQMSPLVELSKKTYFPEEKTLNVKQVGFMTVFIFFN